VRVLIFTVKAKQFVKTSVELNVVRIISNLALTAFNSNKKDEKFHKNSFFWSRRLSFRESGGATLLISLFPTTKKWKAGCHAPQLSTPTSFRTQKQLIMLVFN